MAGPYQNDERLTEDSRNLADAYTAWVRKLRTGKPIPRLQFNVESSLARLGHELQLLADTLSCREEERRRLFGLVQTVEEGISLEDVLNRIFDSFAGLIPYDRIGCALLSDDGTELTARWARSNLGPVQIPVGYSQPLAGSSLERILLRDEPRILNDLEAYLGSKPESDATRRIVLEGGLSSFTCPLIVNRQPIGFLFFTSRSKHTYRDVHQTILRQIVGQVSAVIAKSRLFQQVSYVAHHDALTGLPNRKNFYEQVEQALRRVGQGERLAILYLDLDYFKRVNDTLGHSIGDQLLKSVADRLHGCIRDVDVVARLSGDEFAIIQSSLQQPSDAAALAVRICKAVHAPFDLDRHQIVVDISIGISIAPDDAGEMDELLRAADIALYEAKNAGRGTYCFFESGMNERLRARAGMEQDLRSALANDEFKLVYQPIVNLRDNRISSFEALLRWCHPQRGMIGPAEFIPIAEEMGLITTIGEWVLQEACAEAATWQNDIKVAVNVSPIQFKSQTLALKVAAALAASGLSADRLELEVTETVLISNDETALAMLNQLQELGALIALDDFGTGYSSLSYLQRFPFDKIKIDRCFIKNVAESAVSRSIVQAVVNIAKVRNMTTTAEGVETEQQLELLRNLGCTEMQGYLFSRAIPAAQLKRLLLSRRTRAVAVA